jgi:ABC-2 type transport system permease protein
MALMEDSFSFIKHHWRVWKRMIVMNFATYSASRVEFASYTCAKLLRMGFFLVFVFALFGNTKSIAGYSEAEVLLFFAVMNTLDIALQLIYRGLTQVPTTIRTGDLDLILVKPVSPFFWSAFRMFDLYDLVTLPAALFFLGYAIHRLATFPSPEQIFLGCFFWMISFILSLLLNILIAASAFWITEIENGVWLYRDLIYMARFPPEVFPGGVRWFFTFIIPILVIASFPTKALLHRLSLLEGLWALLLVIGLTLFTRWVWNKAISHYTSASA